MIWNELVQGILMPAAGPNIDYDESLGYDSKGISKTPGGNYFFKGASAVYTSNCS
jgi:hypothetical protein